MIKWAKTDRIDRLNYMLMRIHVGLMFVRSTDQEAEYFAKLSAILLSVCRPR